MSDHQPSSAIPITIHLGEIGSGVLARRNEPVTVGIPLPRGLSGDTERWRLVSADHEALPLQTRILDRWSDGSIRWVLLDFQAGTRSRATETLTLHTSGPGARPNGPRLRLEHSGDSLVLETGGARFRFAGGAPLGLRGVEAGGREIVGTDGIEVKVVAGNGAQCPVRWQRPAVEEQGSLRALVRVDGETRGPGGFALTFVARLHFFAGSPVVRLLLTVRNPRRARHEGGFWELGDRGSVLLKELAIVLRRAVANPGEHVRYSLEPGLPPGDCHGRLEIYQDSSGGEHWRSRNHVNRHGVVPARFRGYRAEVDGTLTEGLRATPLVSLDAAGASLGATFPHFWQNFPRAVEATPRSIALGLFPRQHGDLHELQGGEQKTHEVYLLFGEDRVTELPLDWCRSRLVAAATPEWYAGSGAIPYLTPAATDPHHDYLSLVNAAVDGGDTFLHKRERVDEYGWRHFGEIYGDHEGVFPITPTDGPLVSHYNNQYDPVAGFACQFARSGDTRWWTQCRELAAHVIDVDLYHTDEDKSAYNHGLFWHTVHYVDAGRATHRSYPRAKGSHGGGPSSEHNYPTGLTLYYFMTGDLAAREAALGLSQFVINIDDGMKTVFRWLDHGYTGLASQSGRRIYNGPGRGSGNSLNALIDGHRLSGDREFLDKAEQIVRRSVHPRQDIAALELDDVEGKWFYTMFLQALGKYLDHKSELGELDAMYAYAREALLHYARWMAIHEHLYLDKPEILEYPTETWPAQDLRKSEVFKHAAMHAAGEERDRFLERASFFFDHAISTLKGLPTRTLCRPVVLLLFHGYTHAWFVQHPDAAAPVPPREAVERAATFPIERFWPQKARAIGRAKMIAAVGGLLGAAGLLAGAAWLLF